MPAIIDKAPLGIEHILYYQTDDVVVENTTDETSVLGNGKGNLTIPAHYLAGSSLLKWNFKGIGSDTGNPSLQMKVKLGSTLILDSGAVILGNPATNVHFDISGQITIRNGGASADIHAGGHAMSELETHFALELLAELTGVDISAASLFDITMQWGTASASNILNVQNGFMSITTL